MHHVFRLYWTQVWNAIGVGVFVISETQVWNANDIGVFMTITFKFMTQDQEQAVSTIQ
jgi:hypothetical protein